MTEAKHGKLVCVGTGMRMAGQLTPLARSYIETADPLVVRKSDWQDHIK